MQGSVEMAADRFLWCSFYTWFYFHIFLFILPKTVVYNSDSQKAASLKATVLKRLLLFWQTRNILVCV